MYSNGYIFRYAIIMVIIVGALLTMAAKLLEARQGANQRIEKIGDMLSAAGIGHTKANSEELYNRHIVRELIIDPAGNVIKDIPSDQYDKAAKADRAFNIDLKVMQKQMQLAKSGKSSSAAGLPIFVCVEGGDTLYLIPLLGKGLWASIWGTIALKSDWKTVSGISLDHKSETPGLGAEINQDFFENQFIGKSIFDNDMTFTSIRVIKGGAAPDNMHGVDAISGGTLTSDGVTNMLKDCLQPYEPFIKKQLEQ
jgi:Na+-transporting NADH:ubiquinone oxidoreductase subunit C